MNRSEGRRQARAHTKEPVLIAGEGIVAGALGHKYEARPHAELAEKVPGRHRWVAVGSWVLSDAAVEGAYDPEVMKFLDNENLMNLSVGCWDCEQPLGVVQPDSHCRGEAAP